MKNIISILICVCICASFTQAQEMTKQEKRTLKKQVRKHLKSSIKFYDNHQLDSSEIFIDSVLLLDKKNADGYYYKGLIGLKNIDTTKADSILTIGSTVAPLSTRIKILLSRIKIEQHDYVTASELLDAILMIKPREPETLYLRGLTFLYQNDTTKALEYLQNGLENALQKRK